MDGLKAKQTAFHFPAKEWELNRLCICGKLTGHLVMAL